MSENRLTIDPGQMRALARYEITFDQLVEGDRSEEEFVFSEMYRMTLDDLCAVVRNVLEKDPTVDQFARNWLYPMTEMEDIFGIPAACGRTEGEDDEDAIILPDDLLGGPERVRGLPMTEENVFKEVWDALIEIWSFGDEDAHMAELKPLKAVLKEMQIFLDNADKPILEREYSKRRKKQYISLFENDSHVQEATELELELCRKFTDELCQKGSARALHLKGYACYGGNRLYPCDWVTSRDCMIRLYEKTDDPMYANTLGYIYYYGRCTQGVPEYAKAYDMFSVAAANGLHEGLYKLADLFRHGYGCKKSPRTARALYSMAYEDCHKKFLKGDTQGSFADAALRMGNVYLRGIGEEADPERAYRYYLQADYAARLRAERSDFFGNTTVAIQIRKALDEAEAELGEDFFEPFVSMTRPWIFWGFTEGGYRAGIALKAGPEGNVTVRVERLPGRDRQKADPILLVYPTIRFCQRVTEMEMTAYDVETSFDLNAEKPVKYDSCEWNYAEDRIDFYYDEERVGWITCEEYRVFKKEEAAPRGERLKLVSVTFQPGGRTYDYLCELSDVKVGDRVVVPGYDGETVVEVLKVYTRYASELGLPIERYKKVIRKVEN